MFNFRSRSSSKSNQQPPDASLPYERNGAFAAHELGVVLRERREALGATLAEAEAVTRIRQKYLSALEADDWHLLPGEVVGRGFLRNYTEYLGLDSQEYIDRRRSFADSTLGSILANTSAGSALPPEREVDYRPKEVNLKDEGEENEPREIRIAPILRAIALIALLGLGGLGLYALSGPIINLAQSAGARLTEITQRAPITPTAASDAGQAAENNFGITAPTATPLNEDGPPQSNENGSAAISPTNTPAPTPTLAPVPTETATPPPPPTDTPLPLPTETPVPPPTPYPLPPTETPTPEPPPVVAPACSDPGSAISSPGVDQVVSGVVQIIGTATNSIFQYYKLEYAVGANASGGFVYFDGANGPVANGLLGTLDSRAFPNGAYTLSITVVDQTGNFPTPCTVTIFIEN